MSLLHLGVLLAAAWAVLAIAFQRAGARAYGRRQLFSKSAGDPAKGVVYAFTKGMSPWAKESVRMNLPSYAAGMAFHAGVFGSFFLLLATLAGLELPAWLLLAVRFAAVIGAAGGLSLLVKRMVMAQLRGLSVPDDFVSNLLSTLFVILAFAGTFRDGIRTAWMLETILLLIYVPVGKIRHCFFFFTTRYHLGAFFGRRGTFGGGHA